MHPDLKTAVELQRVDLEIAKLSTQVDEIPSQIQSIQAQLNHSLGAHEERKLRLTANQKERRDLEGEIKVIQEKISKHKDQLYQVKIHLGDIHDTFAAGSRLQVDITSSNFPRHARNTNSGNAVLANDTTADIQIATNVVRHSEEWPSCIVFSVLPTSQARNLR